MKTAAVALLLATTASFAATADARNHYQRGYNNNNLIAGAVIGTAIGTLLSNAIQPRATYVYPQPVYVQPIAPIAVPVTPYYYVQPSACQTVRIPVFDQSGRLIEYVQQCAN